MAEPFPALPSWVVWLTIAFVILTGVICMAAVIAGVFMGKWWLWSLGAVFSVHYYFKVFRLIFQ